MAASIAQGMRFTVDLSAGLIEQPQRGHLRWGDKNANEIRVTVTDGGQPADLTGASASGMFYRPPDGDNVPLTGRIIGNVVTVALNEHCYTEEGQYKADVKLTADGVVRTILTISGYVKKDGSDVLIDVENVVPSVNELLAQLAALKDTTARANAAADRVERMQIDANGLAGDSNMLGGAPASAYAKKGALLLGNGQYTVGAELDFYEPPDNYDYMLGRVAYTGISPSFGGGSGTNRTYILTSITRVSGGVYIYVATLLGTYGTTKFSLSSVRRVLLGDNGTVSSAALDSVQIGALSGYKV